MVDLLEELKAILHANFGDELEGDCAWDWELKRGRKPKYCLGCKLTADAILDRLTLPEDQDGLGLKIMGREPLKPMWLGWNEETDQCAIHNYGGAPDPFDIWKIGFDVAPRYPGAEDERKDKDADTI